MMVSSLHLNNNNFLFWNPIAWFLQCLIHPLHSLHLLVLVIFDATNNDSLLIYDRCSLYSIKFRTNYRYGTSRLLLQSDFFKMMEWMKFFHLYGEFLISFIMLFDCNLPISYEARVLLKWCCTRTGYLSGIGTPWVLLHEYPRSSKKKKNWTLY